MRQVFAILTVVLLAAGGVTLFIDIQAWRQSVSQNDQSSISQVTEEDSASVPSLADKDEDRSPGFLKAYMPVFIPDYAADGAAYRFEPYEGICPTVEKTDDNKDEISVIEKLTKIKETEAGTGDAETETEAGVVDAGAGIVPGVGEAETDPEAGVVNAGAGTVPEVGDAEEETEAGDVDAGAGTEAVIGEAEEKAEAGVGDAGTGTVPGTGEAEAGTEPDIKGEIERVIEPENKEDTEARTESDHFEGSDEKDSSTAGTRKGTTEKTEKDDEGFAPSILTLVFFIFGGICAAAAGVTSVMIYRRKEPIIPSDEIEKRVWKEQRPMIEKMPQAEIVKTEIARPALTCAQFNQIGNRPRQEDCCGVLPMESGMLAVVADGMGGLKNGERVSELVVRSMLDYGQQQQGRTEDGILLPMLQMTNEVVNQTLGPDIYQSGSTLLAVWVQENGKRFQWVTVGDSRIYLYRGGSLIQLNQEHTYGQELLNMAMQGQISFTEARQSTKKGQLTSFIGMGQLKYVDHSVRPIDTQIGDRILLMSDGVFNAVTDQQLVQVLLQYADVQSVADQIVCLVKQFNNPKQDNYTAVILGF